MLDLIHLFTMDATEILIYYWTHDANTWACKSVESDILGPWVVSLISKVSHRLAAFREFEFGIFPTKVQLWD